MPKLLKCVVFVGMFFIPYMTYAEVDPQGLLKRSDHARGGGIPGVIWEITLNSRQGQRVDETQRLLLKAIDQASLAETLEPTRFKGSKLLQVDRNMWLTRPGLSKPIPISLRQRMSGQASNGDIAATNYAKDYEASYVGTDTIENEPCYKLNLIANNNRSTYDRIIYWISIKREVGLKAEFYSLSGKLLKTAIFEYNNLIDYESKRIPFVSKMVIRDALSDAATTMEYRHIKIKSIPQSVFDLGELR